MKIVYAQPCFILLVTTKTIFCYFCWYYNYRYQLPGFKCPIITVVYLSRIRSDLAYQSLQVLICPVVLLFFQRISQGIVVICKQAMIWLNISEKGDNELSLSRKKTAISIVTLTTQDLLEWNSNSFRVSVQPKNTWFRDMCAFYIMVGWCSFWGQEVDAIGLEFLAKTPTLLLTVYIIFAPQNPC